MTGPGWLLGSLVTIAAAAIGAAIAYSFRSQGRRVEAGEPSQQDGQGVVRAMLALVLVGGLVILTGASFEMDDPQTRNLLIGGVVASASAAVAFYFASRQADAARRDVLNAALGTESVPDLRGMKISVAKASMGTSSLVLILPDPIPPGDPTIATQSPDPGISVPKGTRVTVNP